MIFNLCNWKCSNDEMINIRTELRFFFSFAGNFVWFYFYNRVNMKCTPDLSSNWLYYFHKVECEFLCEAMGIRLENDGTYIFITDIRQDVEFIDANGPLKWIIHFTLFNPCRWPNRYCLFAWTTSTSRCHSQR